MPRIDPLQLLKCLSVLLTPEGGILSNYEVPRLVNLMTKFSKKLVSKCIYLVILKNTDLELVDMFMAEGGWALVQTWLQDAIQIGNWVLVKEILELLLVTPVDVQRLKMNVLPKLIKNLSRREELQEVAELSTKLVQMWLSIVKKTQTPQPESVETAKNDLKSETDSELPEKTEKSKDMTIEYIKESETNGALYKTSDKDGKIVIRKVSGTEMTEITEEDKQGEKKGRERSRSSSSSSRSKDKRRDEDRDRDRDRKRSSSSSSRSKSSSSSSSSRSKDDKRDKDRKHSSSSHRSSSSSKSSKSSSSSSRSKDKEKKSDKEKQEEKDQDTLSKLKTPTIDKLGRIPKKSSAEEKPQSDVTDVKKKFSVGIRSGKDDRPKTVKIYNSKMRSTGLEEEVKPAPPRNSTKKPSTTVQLPSIPSKRPSPPKEVRPDPIPPPEKKLKIDKVDVPERPGAIKLIPPKPKPLIQESDIFSDALTAAIPKKEPKKRKRRLSVGGKDVPTSPTAVTPPSAPTTPTSPLGLKNIAPINFYQDTLAQESEDPKGDDEDKENEAEKKNEEDDEEMGEEEAASSPARTPTYDGKDDEPAVEEAKRVKVTGVNEQGLKGVLLYTKKKGPKRSISWKNDDDLVEVKYFELDETERVNVSRTSFGDMAKMDISSEREALQLSRKVGGEDLMEAQIKWRVPMEIDIPDTNVVPGSKSLEKDIQFAREKSVMQALYFDKRRIPDSAEEPVPENHQMVDPAIIPLEDPDCQDIDLRSTPWPEPKGLAPTPEIIPSTTPAMFPNIPGPFQPSFNNIPPPGFQGMPQRFPGPMGPMMGPGFMGPPNMMPPPNGNMMPPDMMNMFPPGPMPDRFGPPGPDFGYGNQMPPNMNMFPPNNFNHRPMGPERGGVGNRGRGGFRPRGVDNGGWVRMNTNNWKRGGGGGGGVGSRGGGKLCKNIQMHGYCRNGDNCMFVHP